MTCWGNVAEGRRPRGSTLMSSRTPSARSISVGVIDVKVVKLAGRAVAAEFFRIGLDARLFQKALQLGDMMGRHLLLDAVGAQALDLALDVELRLVDRIPQALPGIAADHQIAGL